jgi:E3 ubiquitin-protein ligase UBR4
MDTLTSFLGEVGRAGEASQEFMRLYCRLVASGEWHYYLAVRGVLTQLAQLIEAEIAYFGVLEVTRLGSDLALGFAVKELTGLLSSLLEQGRLKAAYKSRLVSAVLGGYLSLRRLVIQRTKMVDETQDRLLTLLEDLTTGTEEETRAFMRCCVETLARYPPDDHLTPVFIFERLCSLIYPEEADTGEFFLALEKDPQQEEFLQGRMLGNPYSSREAGLGPLMREIKNKICMDCELVALLEDDNGMELLVNNKIISLDLPVKDVYQRVWLPEAGEAEPMRVVYRMRGLLGDATEEFIESLDKKEGGGQRR